MPEMSTLYDNKGIQVLKLEGVNSLSPKLTIESDAPINCTEDVYVLVASSDKVDESHLSEATDVIAEQIVNS